ncbi:Response regulator PleD [Poriferisphaera corsica]|uniref:diguanylate cyclase n=1 Tax=Poriferisphaera corsica TaxID=2528020 RepID=A0A517YTF2_9BACT|nr:GGDEF domain-containing protein [Poriferisphaera corsica]QDU33506.1 Response regulator PleD [Poriferisphaera corsica]
MTSHVRDELQIEIERSEMLRGERRLRVLCVGGGELISAVSKIGDRVEIACCENYMMALGELAKREVDVVIGQASGLVLAAGSIARGLKRLAPNARLVMVADVDEGVLREAAENGFDAMVGWPLDTELLRVALMGGSIQQVTEPDVVVHELKPIEQDENADHDIDPSEDIDADDALGDVDLVDALLDDEGGLRKMAMRLIAQQSGMDGMRLVGPSDEVNGGESSVAVEYGGRVFGVLCGPRDVMGEDDLAMWSAWLSRWLALEDQVRQLHMAAMKDDLTGAWNRRYFYRFLEKIMVRARSDRSQVTVMVFDIDDFKKYNDRYGHAAGDEILSETVRLMNSVVREHDVVARIGGDEFAVIFWDADGPRKANSRHPEDVIMAARRFQKAVCGCEFPKLADESKGTLTVSGGLASYPWDGCTGEALVEKADGMALESKRKGKNAIMYGQGGDTACGHRV